MQSEHFSFGEFFQFMEKITSNAWIEKCSMWALHDDDLVDINSLKVKVK